MELNKIVGALCATLLAYLGLQFFGEKIYAPHHGEHELAYALEIEEDSDVEEEEEVIDLATLLASTDAAAGEKVFRKCSACHKLEDGANGAGPHLYNLINREIGAVAGFNYSGALPAEAWTADNLFAFLEAPKKWAPGTSMGFAGLKKPEDRAALIHYLNEVGGAPQALQ